jgi:hypothetical protein
MALSVSFDMQTTPRYRERDIATVPGHANNPPNHAGSQAGHSVPKLLLRRDMMNNLRIVVLAGLAALSLTACLDDSTPGTIEIVDDKADQAGEPGTERDIQAAERAQCDLLPQDDSACAHACEPDVLLTFVPAHQCITFKCALTDGETLYTGGCNP